MPLSKISAQYSQSIQSNYLAANNNSSASCPNGRQCRTHPIPVIGDKESFDDYKKRCAEWKEQHGLKFEAPQIELRSPSSYGFEKIGHWNDDLTTHITKLYDSTAPKVMDTYDEGLESLSNAASNLKEKWQQHPTAVKIGAGIVAVAVVAGLVATAPVWGAALAGTALVGGIAWSATS